MTELEQALFCAKLAEHYLARAIKKSDNRDPELATLRQRAEALHMDMLKHDQKQRVAGAVAGYLQHQSPHVYRGVGTRRKA